MTTVEGTTTGSRPDGEEDALSIYAKLLRGEIEGDTALKASQQMLQMVFDTIPQAIWWKDRKCVFLGVNRILANMAGVEPEEMIGKSDFDMPWASGEPYGADWYQDWDREVMKSGVPQFGIKERLLMPDGQTIWVETNKVPLRDLKGDVIGVLGTFTDVTKRHLADEARKQAIDDLDERVKTRTSALRKANESLRREIEDRKRLEVKERKQRAYAEALRDTAAAVAESLDLDETLEQVLVGVDRLMKHNLAAIVLTDEHGISTLAHTRESWKDHVVAGCELGAVVDHVPFMKRLGDSEEHLIDNDVRGESFGDETRSAMGVPITVSESRIGYIIVESVSPGYFTEAHLERLNAVSDLAGAAISNAQLFSSEAELATLEERQRLARELHDAVSQTLWTANLVSESIRANDSAEEIDAQLIRLKALTKGALAEMRTLLLELRPASMAETRFTALLEQLVDALKARRSIDTTISVPEPALQVEPTPQTKHALYRIAQEALNNVGRHSGATEVEIEVQVTENYMTMRIRDNGTGFDVTSTGGDRMGLSIMRERAEQVGASIELASQPGFGTTLAVLLPIDTAGQQQ